MKRHLTLILLLTISLLPLCAQTQTGYVRTAGRPDNKEGKRISGVEIRIRGKHNAVVTNKKGIFSFNLGGEETSYIINGVTREGYELQEKELIGRREPLSSTVQKEIVMISLHEKQQIEEKIRQQVEEKYQQKLQALQRDLKSKTISEERYRTELARLENEYEMRDRLVRDMVERYANSDYARMSEKEIEINTYIENGELEKADSVINSLNLSKLEQDRNALLQDITVKESQIAKEKSTVKSIDSTLLMAYRGKADLFFADFQNDSCIYYLEKAFAIDNQNATLAVEIGANYNTYMVDKAKSLAYLNKAIELIGEDTLSTIMISCLNDMAYCYEDFGVLDTAKIYYDRALRLARKMDDKARIALVLNNLSHYYKSVSDIDNQKRCIEESLRIRISLYGERSPEVMIAYNNLAIFYSTISDYRQAISYDKKALSLLPENNDTRSHISTIYNNLANYYAKIGLLDSAEYYYDKCHKLYITMYGQRHPQVATLLSNMSGLASRREEYQKALSLQREALTIDLQFFGEMHISVGGDYHNLSTIFGTFEKTDSALYYALKAERIYYSFDTLHRSLLQIYNNIGSLYDDKGELRRALAYYGKAEKIIDAHPNENKSEIASYYMNVGTLFYEVGRYKTALEYFEESLQVLNEVYQKENIHYYALFNNLGILYDEVGEYSKALEYHHKSERLLAENKMSESIKAARTTKSIGIVYFHTQNYDSALWYMRKAHSIYMRHISDTAARYLPMLHNFTKIFMDSGNYDSALVYAYKQWAILTRIGSTDEDNNNEVLMTIYNCLLGAGRSEEFREYMSDKAYVVDIAPDGQLASRGYEGRYVLLEWKGWNINENMNIIEEWSKKIDTYTISVFRDGKVSQEAIEGKAGTSMKLIVIGKEAKQEAVKAYNNREL